MNPLNELGISPAPWEVSDDLMSFPECALNVKCNLWDVAKYCRPADARLIAAAPDCLASLDEVLTALKNRLPSQPTLTELEIIIRAEAAIRKATGESEAAKEKPCES